MKLIWQIKFEDKPRKFLKKLDKNTETQILKYLHKIINSNTNPKSFGKPLLANMSGLWRYRVGDYRIICNIEDNILLILVVDIGHRAEVYKN